MMQKHGEKPRVVGYLCEVCVAEAKGECWQPELGDKVALCEAHADFFFGERS